MGKFSFTIEGVGLHSSAPPDEKCAGNVDKDAVELLRKLQARGVPITRATFVHHPGGRDELVEEWVEGSGIGTAIPPKATQS